jgi:hypothetical protein
MNVGGLIFVTISLAVGGIPVLFVKRSWILLALSIPAYFLAILSKAIVSSLLVSVVDSPTLVAYLIAGTETALAEVGLAYVFLWLGRRSLREAKMGFTYGIYLAFWENFILLGLLDLLNLSQLTSSTVNFIPLLLPHFLDRVTSLLAHMYWGFMDYMAVFRGKLRYLFMAMPLGFIDSLAAWWDLTKAIPYLEFATVAFLLTLLSVPVMMGVLRWNSVG